MYILDTDHVSLLERGGPDAQRLHVRLASLKAAERVTTIITFEEQMRGWLAYISKTRSLSRQVETYGRLKGVLERYLQITVLDFDEVAAGEAERLKKLRLGIGTMDLKIAAIAIANDATLLTRNVRDFNRVPRLVVEDWTA